MNVFWIDIHYTKLRPSCGNAIIFLLSLCSHRLPSLLSLWHLGHNISSLKIVLFAALSLEVLPLLCPPLLHLPSTSLQSSSSFIPILYPLRSIHILISLPPYRLVHAEFSAFSTTCPPLPPPAPPSSSPILHLLLFTSRHSSSYLLGPPTSSSIHVF